ncbi:MFS transporter [Kitasatospora sp. NBC_00458]|uniref:MFS transporter n=1 Tax=Kitasatospora sp. NBC_00458 TaxID=2903568 RepID=UPI002E19DB23
MTPESPWRIPDFRTLFTATALVQLSTNVGYVVIPLIAVTALDASAGQVGALATLGTVAFLLIGLPAGAWVDRMRHRRVLIAADLAKAVLYASIPIAWAFGGLTLWQLYAVALLSGCATVFFDIASQSVLPRLVGRGHLVQANAAVIGLMALGNIAGRGAGGALVQLLTAPAAIVATAVGHFGSALRLAALHRTPVPTTPATPPGAETAPAPGLGRQIAEGVRHVLGNAELRALALSAALVNLGYQLVNTLLPVLFVRELHLSAGALGLFWAAGGVGVLLGSRCARLIAARVGYGRTLVLAGLAAVPAALLVPVIGDGFRLYVAGFGWLLLLFRTGVDNVLGVSLRQRMTPDALLGRMNATFRFVLTGAMPVGAALAGLLGELVGLHATLWVGGVMVALSFLPVLLSPIRSRRSLPDAAVVYGSAPPRPQAGADPAPGPPAPALPALPEPVLPAPPPPRPGP